MIRLHPARDILGLALVLAATVFGCSSAPAEEPQRTEDALRAPGQSCPPFTRLDCTRDGSETGNWNTVVCECVGGFTGPVGAPAVADRCGMTLPPPAGIADCTFGMTINAGEVWLCPAGAAIPWSHDNGVMWWTADEAHPFVSNCVGNLVPGSGYMFLTRYGNLTPGSGCGQACCHGPCTGPGVSGG